MIIFYLLTNLIILTQLAYGDTTNVTPNINSFNSRTKLQMDNTHVGVKTKLIKPSIKSAIKNINYASMVYCNDTILNSWNCKACHKVPNSKLVKSIYNSKFQTKAIIVVDEDDKAIILS